MTTVLRRALVPVPRRPLTILLAERHVDVPAVAAYRRALVVARPLRKGELGQALRSLMTPWRWDEMGSMEAP